MQPHATGDAYGNAKKWEVAAVLNFDFGIGPAKKIFDALQHYAKMKAAYLQSLYNRQLAMANLVYAVSEDPLAAK
jgi:outer membrane protein